MSDQAPIDQLTEIHVAAKRLGSEIPSPDCERVDDWIAQISSVYIRMQNLALDEDASSDQVGLAMEIRGTLANAIAEAICIRPSDLPLFNMLWQLLGEINLTAKRVGSQIPSSDIERVDGWIAQISYVYHLMQNLALDGDAPSEQVGLAMDAREILANALADGIWLRPDNLTLLVMLRELHYLYQEDNVRFALARALATCEPCPQWVSDLVVTDPNQLKEYMKTLDESRVAELRELYSDYQEQEVFEQLLRVAPDAKPNTG